MKNEEPNYYAVIPANVRYDTELKDKAKLLYGEITSLCNISGCCYANNKYFANLYKVSQTTISLLIKNLVDRGYITSEIKFKENTKEIENRYLRITSDPYLRNLKYPSLKNLKYPVKENLKENNININNKENNNINIIIKESFKKPTIEEIKAYCLERHNNIDAEHFYDFYESKAWMIGKNKMKDWKACVRTWEQRNKPNETEKLPSWFGKEVKEENNEERKKLAEQLTNGTWKP